MQRRTLILAGVCAVLVIMIAAYLDGGKEPVRPIEEAVAIPGGGISREN